MKKILFLIPLFLSVSLSAQDIITLRTGEQIRARVTEISTTELRFRLFEQPTGPIRVTPLSEVFAITYENGTREVFNTAVETRQEPQQQAQTASVQAQTAQPTRGITMNGIVAGINFTHGGLMGNLFNWANALSADYFVSSKMGFQIGYVVDRKFRNPNWGVQGTYSFIRLGFEDGGRDGWGLWTREMRFWFLHIRFDLHYRFRFENVELLPHVGLFANYAFHYRITTSDGRGNESGFGLARFPDVGFVLGVALRIREGFQIGASYNLGILSNYTMINLAYFFR